MKFLVHTLVLLAGILFFFLSCRSDGGQRIQNLAPNAHQVVAREIIQTSKYTYVRVDSDGRDYWIATNRMEVQKGGTYFWSIGSEMNDFTSNELNQTFESIFFVQDFTDKPITGSSQLLPGPATGRQQPPEHKGIEIPKAENGLSISELYALKENYTGKIVRIRGEVIKFSSNIMGRNWAHIQDGTRDGEHYDLTVTTKAFINVGDVVIFEGMVSVNKDFGAGYLYPVILEDAVVK